MGNAICRPPEESIVQSGHVSGAAFRLFGARVLIAAAVLLVAGRR
jgi:hypothetical protein